MRIALALVCISVAMLPGCRSPLTPTGDGFDCLISDSNDIVQPAGLLNSDGNRGSEFQQVRYDDESVLIQPEQQLEALQLPTPVEAAGTQLAELEQLAMQNNPSLARTSADVDALQGKWVQAGLPPNPVFGYVAEEINDEGTVGKQGAFVGREFVRGFKLSLSQAVVAEEIETALQELAAQKMRILTDVRIGYFDYLISLRRLELAEELVDIGDKAVRDTEALRRRGEVKPAEVLRAEAEAATLNILLENARNQRDTAWKRLAAVVGLPSLEMLQLSPETVKRQLDEATAAEILREQAIERVLTESPQLAARIANVERARWAVQRAHAEAIPNLNAQLAVQYDAAGDNTIAAVQLGMPIPVYNRNQGGIRQAMAELMSAELAVDEAGLALQRRFESVFQRYANARNQVDQYSKADGILAKTKETLRLTVRGYNAEEFNSLDMLTAQRIYAQANLAYLAALRELRVAATEIEGLLLKNSLEQSPSR